MDRNLDDLALENVARPAIKKRVARGVWSQLRFATTVGALALIAISAALKVDLGTFSSFSIGALTIACPLGVAQVMAASQAFIPALALAGLAGVLLTILFGRAFCGWLCPGRWIFNRGPWQAAQPWRAHTWIQGALAGGVIGLSWVCHTPAFCVICPAGVICRGAIAAGTGSSLLPTLGWLSGLVGFEWLSRRSWCRDLCPLGAAISLMSKLNPFIKVKADPERCRPCAACAKACPEGQSLARDGDFSTCVKCFECVAACPRGAVEIKLLK